MSQRKTEAEQRQERLAKALKRNIALRKAGAKPAGTAGEPPEPQPDDNGCPN